MGGKSTTHELALLDQAGQALAEARSLDEIRTIRDKAEAVRKYAQSASLGLDVQNRAAEVKLRAERQAGKLLSQLMLRGGDRRSKSRHERLKLVDLGLSANQSKRWQLQARVPEQLFLDHVRLTCRDGKELTSAGLMRLAKRLRETESTMATIAPSTARREQPPSTRNISGETPRQSTTRHWVDATGAGRFGEIVGELRNHHRVLDGILGPICSGESSTLRPAELRALKYLLNETGSLLAQLDSAQGKERNCSCHRDRAAS